MGGHLASGACKGCLQPRCSLAAGASSGGCLGGRSGQGLRDARLGQGTARLSLGGSNGRGQGVAGTLGLGLGRGLGGCRKGSKAASRR